MSVDKLKESCIVVGAGIAGLCSAHVLQDGGVPVIVLDQGRAVGGRLATRVIKQGVFDYGAQFFTVRDQRLGAWLTNGRRKALCKNGVVDFSLMEHTNMMATPAMSGFAGWRPLPSI